MSAVLPPAVVATGPAAGAGTPWAAGRLGGSHGRARLMFAHMYEDHGIEEAALAGCRRILAVASAGDTALALVRSGTDTGVEVTAIDINPAQIAYLDCRIGGGAGASGTGDGRGQAERMLGAGRGILRLAGWRRRRMERFCDLDDRRQQVAEWRRLTTGVSGLALHALLAPAALRAAYQPGFAAWATGLGRQLPNRIEAGLAHHRNRDNPWARPLFLGDCDMRNGTDVRVDYRERLSLVVADVAGHLEGVDPGTYDGFALSNVLDGAPPAYRHRLLAAIERAAPPGAPVVLRTLAPAGSADAAALAATDRALIWGGIIATTAGALR